eukprot:1126287-Pyramimonas_sp.AAC.1
MRIGLPERVRCVFLPPLQDWGRRGGFIRPPAKELDRRHSWIRESTCLKSDSSVSHEPMSDADNLATDIANIC